MMDSSDANALTKEVMRLTQENAELRAELWNQWEYNHTNQCGRGEGFWGETPHKGICTWLVPKVLMTMTSPHGEAS
jgi:hypothetical protein